MWLVFLPASCLLINLNRFEVVMVTHSCTDREKRLGQRSSPPHMLSHFTAPAHSAPSFEPQLLSNGFILVDTTPGQETEAQAMRSKLIHVNADPNIYYYYSFCF